MARKGNRPPDVTPRGRYCPSRLPAEVARLLEAVELLHGEGNERRAVRLADELQECVRRNGSPTGIMERRS